MPIRPLATLLLACGLPLAACCSNSASDGAAAPTEVLVVPGRVTDLAAFEHFIAGHPTAEQFRQRYPDVRLVLPGDIVTKEFRTDNSRYFAELDAQSRIVGGHFG
jgi:hypothetical protein